MWTLDLSVLVVDDYPDAAETLADLLSFHCRTVQAAHSGNEAIEMAAEFDPDVIILDLQMPGMTGFDVAKLLSDQDAERPMLIAITGWCDGQNRTEAFSVGFDYFLRKPATPEQLLAILQERHELLRKQRQTCSAGSWLALCL